MQRKRHILRSHLNRLERRTSEAVAASSSASLVIDTPSSTSTVIPASLPSTSVAAIATVLSLVGAAVILGVVICVYRRHKRRAAKGSPNPLAGKVVIEKEYQSYAEKRIDLTDVSIYTEKPEKAVLTPRSINEPAGWVPQIRAYPPVNILPEPNGSSMSKKPFKSLLSVKTAPDTPQSPPPSYLNPTLGENQSPQHIPILPYPAASTTGPPLPTPPTNRRTKTSFISLAERPVQIPSPRSESFSPQDPIHSKEPNSPDLDELTQKLPRLMTVAVSFTPTLQDELAVKIGDTVRMLDEYKDGWCLVQRVGRIDAPKGAVPRFCLQERRGVVPIVPSRKYSTGSLRSQSSGWR